MGTDTPWPRCNIIFQHLVRKAENELLCLMGDVKGQWLYVFNYADNAEEICPLLEGMNIWNTFFSLLRFYVLLFLSLFFLLSFAHQQRMPTCFAECESWNQVCSLIVIVQCTSVFLLYILTQLTSAIKQHNNYRHILHALLVDFILNFITTFNSGQPVRNMVLVQVLS